MQASLTKVKHLIIHHSAGSNTDTNFVNTVRNIYLFHTQTNGWDDIGYNYLIARNGDIFDGRDGGIHPDDEVIGAHMCARNANTMGICLLGNFHNNVVFPSDTSIQSLLMLCSWKLYKDSLWNAFDSSQHPVNAPVHFLGKIVGHQEGCPSGYTDCPGSNVLPIIHDALRKNCQKQMDACLGVGFSNQQRPQNNAFFPNPNATGLLYGPIEAQHIQLFDMKGELLHGDLLKAENIGILSVEDLPAGIYILNYTINQTAYYQRIIKLF